MTDDDDDRLYVRVSNTMARCLTVIAVALIICVFGTGLYHCDRQATRRLRCVELIHDVEKCSEAFGRDK